MHKLKIAERQRLGIPEDRGLVFEQDNVNLPLKPKSQNPLVNDAYILALD